MISRNRPTGLAAWSGSLPRFGAVLAVLLGFMLAPLTLARPLAASAAVTVTSHFIWTTTSSNVSSSFTTINNGATNGAPKALLFITPNYDPGGVCGCVTDLAHVGAVWNDGAKQWTIFNLDLSVMQVGVSFNIMVVQKASSQAFVATATSANMSANGTVINKTATNGKSNALLQVTPTLPQGPFLGVFNAHPIGVVYGLGAGGNQWAIQNVDNASMPTGAKFNVMVGAKPSNGGKAVLLTGTSANTVSTDTFISNSQTTGNPNTIVFETQNADPGFNFGSGDIATTGVAYRASPTDLETVFNEDGTSMPTSTHYFNLLVFPS